MPVILPREVTNPWLDTEITDPALLSELLVPYTADDMELREVSTLVNSPRNNSPEILAPVQHLL